MPTGLHLAEHPILYTNLPLGYLYNDQYDEVEKWCLKLKDKIYENNGKPYRFIFLEDFGLLEQAGITHPDVKKIKRLLEE